MRAPSSSATVAARMPAAGSACGKRRGRVSMLCHGWGRSADGAVMPWPGIPILVHSPASWPGTGLAGGSAPDACSAATISPGPSAINARRSAAPTGGCSSSSRGKGRPAAEDPGGDDVEQELAGTMRVPGHGDVRRRDRRVQVDAGRGLAGGRDQVKPADLARRVRAQQELGDSRPAAIADLVAGTAVICRGERAEGPAGHDEPRAARRPQYATTSNSWRTSPSRKWITLPTGTARHDARGGADRVCAALRPET
jgi:hypothetical protein